MNIENTSYVTSIQSVNKYSKICHPLCIQIKSIHISKLISLQSECPLISLLMPIKYDMENCCINGKNRSKLVIRVQVSTLKECY